MQSTTSRISSAFSSAVEKFSNCGKLVLVIYVCFGILYIAASPSVLIKSHGIPNNINKNMKKQIQNENKQNVEQKIMLKHKPEFDYLNNFKENNNHHYEYKSSDISQIYIKAGDINHKSAIDKHPFKSHNVNNKPDLSSKSRNELDHIDSKLSLFNENKLRGKRETNFEKFIKQTKKTVGETNHNIPRGDKSSTKKSQEIFHSTFAKSSSPSSSVPKNFDLSSETRNGR